MKKFYIFISIIIYIILIAILYKNYSITQQQFYFNYERINSFWIVILLSIKFILDCLIIIKRDSDLFVKISNSFIFIVILSWIIFIPNPNSEIMLLSQNLRKMLELNQRVFSFFDLKNNKLPSDKIFKNFEDIDLGSTVYLKTGDIKYHYKIKLLYQDSPILNPKKSPPGTFFIVVSKKNNDFYITATILDPKTQKTSMIAMNNEIIVLNKNINIEEIYKRKKKMELIKKMYFNLKNK